MAKFEGYDRRIPQINKVLAEYGFNDLDSMADFVKAQGRGCTCYRARRTEDRV